MYFNILMYIHFKKERIQIWHSWQTTACTLRFFVCLSSIHSRAGFSPTNVHNYFFSILHFLGIGKCIVWHDLKWSYCIFCNEIKWIFLLILHVIEEYICARYCTLKAVGTALFGRCFTTWNTIATVLMIRHQKSL